MRRPNRKRRRKNIITWSKLLTEEEQKQLFEFLKTNQETPGGIRELLICDLMIHTGLRANELCCLRVQDTPQVLGVEAIEVYRGKFDKDRTIPISSRLARFIKNYIKLLRGQTMPRYIKRGDVSKPLFYSRVKRPYTPNALYLMVHRVGRQAGITKKLHPHMFRHTFATNSLLQGIDIYVLQQLMGHSGITATAGYLHLVSAHLKGLGNKLDVCCWD